MGHIKYRKRPNKVDYLIDEKGKPNLYHANILKKYHRRNQARNINADEEDDSLVNNCSSIMWVQFCVTDVDADDHLPITPDGRVKDAWEGSNGVGPCTNPSLEEKQEKYIKHLLESFSYVFSESGLHLHRRTRNRSHYVRKIEA